MKKINFIEVPKEEKDVVKQMFPQMFKLTDEELMTLRGGNKPPDCDAVCLPTAWGGTCSCYSNLA